VRLFDAGARTDGPEVVHDRVLTVPNLITTLRLAGLPVFVWLLLVRDARAAAFAVLVAIGATDWVDGYVARRFDQVSRIGKLLDPMIDRLLLATAGITLVVAGIVPLWVLLVIVARDVALLVGALLLFGGIPPIAVTRTGKFATACLLIGLPAFLPAAMDWAGAGVSAVLAWGSTLLGAAGYWVAGVQYLRLALDVRRTGTAGAGDPPA
jgi:cardiolipin synthase (CMP-forming)